ncbi:DUF1275 domain-containing protein [Mesorhizobium sp. BR1-1-16]|uniref:YoaK family protein n=1 Tax=Mesorhizobium sp. BR1-1-16 TaxID=2876653 RepID=UPI001CC97BD2|nr:YoaK family protein [Mesorhizobium sp. BR1-1-16]MBZ9934769.1 DUF1275 domain-containing protein [Mesorhizobium sp. BR1-1-16]
MRMPAIPLAVLLGFNGGFVDTAGFLGLQGLFTSHVTGNFVTLGASLVLGTSGVVTKMLAIPVFIVAVGLTRLAGNHLADNKRASMPVLFSAQAVLLGVFFLLAVTFGPFADGDAPMTMLAGLTGVCAMAIQNAVQRMHLSSEPPTTILTGTTTQFAIDLMDLITKRPSMASQDARRHFMAFFRAILCFGAGSMLAAASFYFVGLACLIVAVAVASFIAVLKARDVSGETGMLM